MFAILITQFYGNLSNWSLHQPHREPLLLNECGENFDLNFYNNIDHKCNEGMACITHSVVNHAYLKRSQICNYGKYDIKYATFSKNCFNLLK